MDINKLLKSGFKLTLIASFFFWHVAIAAPEGGSVVQGSAQISQTQNQTVINQSSQNAVINWNSFNTASHEAVLFNQPNSSAIALNRITNGLPTQFAGQLNANGQVWILNPAGVLFTSTAQIDVAGLVATTHSITNDNFMSGNYKFDLVPGYENAKIINNGLISVKDSGIVALVGPGVENNGVIIANLGKVHLASGSAYTLDMYGDSLINFGSSAPIQNGSVSNSGLIKADGGKVYMTANYAANVLDNMISMSGTIEAKSVGVNKNGEIVLYGADYQAQKLAGTTKVSGKISAPKGFVETSGQVLVIEQDAVIETGNWLIDPADLTISTGANSNVTGSSPFQPTAASSVLNVTTLQNALASGNVTVQTNNDGFAGSGNITVANAVTWSSGNSLTLQAFNNIIVNAALNGGATGFVTLQAGGSITGAGVISANTLTTSSVTGVSLTGLNTATNFNATNTTSGNIAYTHTGALNITGITQNVGNLTITNTGAITQSGPISVSGTSSFTAGAGAITLTDAANSFVGGVALSNTGANDATISYNGNLILNASSVGRNLSVTVSGANSITLNGNITTGASGVQTYNNPVLIGANLILTASNTAGSIVFINSVNDAALRSHSLTLTSPTFPTFFSAPGGTTPLATLNFSEPSINVDATLAAFVVDQLSNKGTSVGLTANSTTLTVSSPITQTANPANVTLTLAATTTNTINAAITLITGGSFVASGSSGINLGANISTGLGQTYSNALSLTATPLTLTSSAGAITFSSTINGAADLTINAATTETFNGIVGGSVPLASLTVTAPSNITVNTSLIRTTGNQLFNNGVVLGPFLNQVFQSTVNGNITFGSFIASNGPNTTVAVNSAGTANFFGTVSFPGDGMYSIDLTAANGISITLAAGQRIAADHSITIHSNLVVNGYVSFEGIGGVGFLTFMGSIDGPGTLVTSEGGAPSTTHFYGPIGSTTPLSALTVFTNGPGNTMTFHDVIHVAGAVSLITSSYVFLDAASPVVDTMGSLSTSAGVLYLRNHTISTTGNQGYNLPNSPVPLWLYTNTTLTSSGGNISYKGPMNSCTSGGPATCSGSLFDLNISAPSGTVTLQGGAVGSSVPINNLTITGTASLNSGSVITQLNQIYNNSVSLAVANTLTSNAGSITFGGAVSGVSLVANAPANIFINGGSVNTSGAQNYNNAVILGADTTLTSTGSTLNFSSINSDGTPRGLTLTAAGMTTLSGNIGTAVSPAGKLRFLTITNAATIATPTINTTQAQTYSGPLTLTANAALNTDAAGTITFGSTIQGGFSLSANASSTGTVNFNNDIGTVGTPLTGLTVTGLANIAAAVGPTIFVSGTETFNNAVSINSLAALTFGSGIGSTTVFNGAVNRTVTSTAITIAGNLQVGPLGSIGLSSVIASLLVNGTTLGPNVTTSGNQTYTGAVTLNTDETMISTAGSITYNSTINGAFNLIVRAMTSGQLVTFNGNVGSGTPLASLIVNDNSALGGINIANNVSFTTTGNQTYNGPMTLQAFIDAGTVNMVTTSGGNVLFNSTIGDSNSGTHILAVNSTGDVTFVGAVATIRGLVVTATNGIKIRTSSIQIAGNFSAGCCASSAINFISPVTLFVDTTVATGWDSIAFGSTIDSDSVLTPRSLTVNSNPINGFNGLLTIAGNIGATAPLQNLTLNLLNSQTVPGLAAINVNGSIINVLGTFSLSTQTNFAPARGEIHFNGGAGAVYNVGSLVVDADTLGTIYFNVPTINSATGQTYSSPVQLQRNVALNNSTSGNITFSSTINGDGVSARSLTTNSAGSTVFGGIVGGVQAPSFIDVTGGVGINTTAITTSGLQIYRGAGTLGANPTLTSQTSTITFNSTLNGGFGLTTSVINGQSVTFNGAVGGTTALTSLTTSATGTTYINGGQVRTSSGAQNWNNPVFINANTTLGGVGTTGAININSQLDSFDSTPRSLTLTTTAMTTLTGNIGNTNKLSALTVTNASTINTADVYTTTSQTYSGAVTLGVANINLHTDASGTLTFGNTVNGASNLTLNTVSSGIVNFNNAIGATTALTSLSIPNSPTININTGTTSIRTVDSQTYSGPILFNSLAAITFTHTNLTAPRAITFNSTVRSAVTQTAITITGNLAVGALGSIGIGSPVPVASLSVSGTTLGPNVTTSGNQIYSGAVTLNTDETMTSTAGNITFSSTVNGDGVLGRNLTLNASSGTGTVTFSGNVGASVPLSTINVTATTIQNNGTGITSTGAQNYTGIMRILNNSTGTFNTTLGGDITFNGVIGNSENASVNNNNHFVTNSTGQVIFNANVGIGLFGLNSVDLTATNGIVINNSTVTTTTFHTYRSPVILKGNASFTNYQPAPIQFLSTVDSCAAGPTCLTPATFTGTFNTIQVSGISPSVVTFSGAVGSNNPMSSFTITNFIGTVTFNSTFDVAGPVSISNPDQYVNIGDVPPTVTFNGAVGSIAPPTSFNISSSVGFPAYVPSIVINNSLRVTGAVTLSASGGVTPTVTLNGALGTLANPLGSLTVTAAGFINFNSAVGSTVYVSGAEVFNGPVFINNIPALQFNGTSVTFNSSLDSPTVASDVIIQNNLILATAGSIGQTNPLNSLLVNGTSSIGGNITTVNNQTYTGATTLTATRTLISNLGSILFGNTVDGAFGLTVSALSGSTTFNGAVGLGTALVSITTNGTANINGGQVRTSSGAQNYNDQVYINADTILGGAGTTGAININFALDSANATPRALTLTTTGMTTLTGNLGNTNILSGLTVTNAATLNANLIHTTTFQTYNGAVTLAGNSNLLTDAGGIITFGSTIQGGFNLSANASSTGTVNFNNDIGTVGTPLTGLTVTGTAQINANVAPTIFVSGTQTYNNNVLLNSIASITFGSGIGSTTVFNGTVNRTVTSTAITIAGNLEVGPLGSIGLSSVIASLLVNGTTLGPNVTTSGDQTYTGALTLNTNETMISTGGNISYGSTVDGAFTLTARAMAVSRYVIFNGIVGGTTPLANLILNDNAALGTVRINTTAINTSGSQTYNSPTFLMQNLVMTTTVGTVVLNNTLDSYYDGVTVTPRSLTINNATAGGGGNEIINFAIGAAGNGQLTSLTITQPIDGIFINAPINVATALNLQSNATTGSGTVTFGGPSGTTHLVGGATISSSAGIFINGGNSIQSLGPISFTVGGLGGSLVNGPIQLVGGNVTLTAAGLISFNGSTGLNSDAVITPRSLTLNGSVIFGTNVGNIAPLNVLQVAGSTSLSTITIDTVSHQIYSGQVTSSGAPVFTSSGGNINFNSVVNGGGSITANVTSPNAVTFASTVGQTQPLAFLTTNGSGTTNINGGIVISAGAQTYNTTDVVLGANTTLTASAVTLPIVNSNGTPRSLTINAAGTSTLNGNIGAGVGGILSTFSNSGLTNINAAIINTQAAQTYTGAVTLSAPTINLNTTVGGNILFGSTINGASNLTVNPIGTVTFTGAVGATTALNSIVVNGTNTFINGGSVRTNGAQTYTSPIVLGANTILTSLSGGAFNFVSIDSDGTPRALTLNTTALTTLSGNIGTAAVPAGILSALTITGPSNISTALINTTTSQTYTGPVTLGVPTIALNTNAGGSILFGNTVNGASDLTVNATPTGTVTFGGVVGTTPLNSLTVNGLTNINTTAMTTINNMIFNQAVILGDNSTLTSTFGNMTFNSTVDGGFGLTTSAASGTTMFSGIVGGTTPLTSLSVTGIADINTSLIHTTSNQHYYGPVVLDNDATLQLSGDTLTFDGAVSGAHYLTIFTPATVQINGDINITDLNITASSAININTANIQTNSNQMYDAPAVVLQFNPGSTLTSPFGNMTFTGTLDGPFSLTIDKSHGVLAFNDVVGGITPLVNLTVVGTGFTSVYINTSAISTSGFQNYNDGIMEIQSSSVTFTGTSVTFGIDVVNKILPTHADLTIVGDLIVTSNAGFGAHQIIGFTDYGYLNSLHVTGTATLNDSVATQLNQTYDQSVTLLSDLVMNAIDGGTIWFKGSVTSNAGPWDLLINTPAYFVNNSYGVIKFDAQVGVSTSSNAANIDNLNVKGSEIDINTAAINTNNTHTYAGPVKLFTDTVLTSVNSGINFNDTVDSDGTPRALTLDAFSPIVLIGNIGNNSILSSLEIINETHINTGIINTTISQLYDGVVVLGADAVLTTTNASGFITFGNILNGDGNGPWDLTINTDEARFKNVIGGVNPLDALTVNADIINFDNNATSVTTLGIQSYIGATAMTIGLDPVFTASSFVINIPLVILADTTYTSTVGDIDFQNTVDGPANLILNPTGTAIFQGDVGATTALASLTVNGLLDISGATVINTDNNQFYGDLVTLNNNIALTAGTLGCTTTNCVQFTLGTIGVDGITGPAFNLAIFTYDASKGAAGDGIAGTVNVAGFTMGGSGGGNISPLVADYSTVGGSSGVGAWNNTVIDPAATGMYCVNGNCISGSRILIIDASDETKVYGQIITPNPVADVAKITVTGLAPGDSITSIDLASAGYPQTATVAGSTYTITASNASGAGLTNHYTSIVYNNTPGALTVDPAPLTVTADNVIKTYGQTITFTGSEFSITSGMLFNSDTLTSVTLNSAGAASTANVAGSPYFITPSAAVGSGLSNYTITYDSSGTITVNQAALTITPNDITKTYGTTTPSTTSGFVLSGIQNSETVGTIDIASAGLAPTATVAGSTYPITASNATGGTFDPNNYIITYATTATITVNPAPLDITPDSIVKTYGTTTPGTTSGFTINPFTPLQNGETIGTIDISSAGLAPTASVLGGPYAVTGSNASGGTFDPNNYAINYVSGATITVNPAPLDITPDSIVKTYGTTTPGTTSAFTVNPFTPLQNGETIGTIDIASAGLAPTASVLGGPYAITGSNASGGTFDPNNYVINYLSGATITVNPAPLDITPDSIVKTYGTTTPGTTSAFTVNPFTPLQNGETIGTIDISSAGLAPTASVLGGPYAITGSNASGGTFDPNNYAINYVSGATITVNPAPLDITPDSIVKTYGTTTPGTTSAFTVNPFTPLQNGETIGAIDISSAGLAPTASVLGGPYAITGSNASGGTFDPNNYAINYVSGATITVNPAPLDITPDSIVKTYGTTTPGTTSAFTVNPFTPLQNGETIGTIDISSAGLAPTASVLGGPYAITGSNASGGTFDPNNYAINYLSGADITVNPAVLTITSLPQTKVEGDFLPLTTTSFMSSGLQNGETVGTVEADSLGLSPSAAPGTYPYISVSNAAGGTFDPTNYIINYVVGGNVTVLDGPEPINNPINIPPLQIFELPDGLNNCGIFGCDISDIILIDPLDGFGIDGIFDITVYPEGYLDTTIDGIQPLGSPIGVVISELGDTQAVGEFGTRELGIGTPVFKSDSLVAPGASCVCIKTQEKDKKCYSNTETYPDWKSECRAQNVQLNNNVYIKKAAVPKKHLMEDIMSMMKVHNPLGNESDKNNSNITLEHFPVTKHDMYMR